MDGKSISGNKKIRSNIQFPSGSKIINNGKTHWKSVNSH